MWVQFNNNPDRALVGDCTVRAISKALGKTWDDTYMGLTMQGFRMKDMPSSNRVWGEYLYENGFRRFIIPDSCPDCYTIKDFCKEHDSGKYILATGTHVVCAVNGSYYDSWDSGDEIPIYYWRKEVNKNAL